MPDGETTNFERPAMKTIYKYPITLQNTFDISMPQGAKILSCGVQVTAALPIVGLQGSQNPVLWALVEANAASENRHFVLVATGEPVPDFIPIDRATFIGTLQFEGGRFIFHLFEVV